MLSLVSFGLFKKMTIMENWFSDFYAVAELKEEIINCENQLKSNDLDSITRKRLEWRLETLKEALELKILNAI